MKVYKIKDKFAIYIPFEVIKSLGIKEGDEIDFINNGNYFTFVKRTAQKPTTSKSAIPQVSQKEVSVLMKLDTLRYSSRTKEKVNSILNDEERKILQELQKKKFVTSFKKPGEQDFKYGIAKSVYDNYLFGKRTKEIILQMQANQAQSIQPVQVPKIKVQEQQQQVQVQKKWEKRLMSESDSYVGLLESKGYIVLPSEIEASAASSSLEESIRRGMVVGVRAFNKRFYIATKTFITQSMPKISKALGEKAMSVPDMAKETGIDPDGVRAILYIMADNGDVTEVRRDVFKVA